MAANRRSDSSANIALLQEVWLQAAKADEPMRIPCGEQTEAHRMRMALYNATRNAKKFPAEFPTLFEAVDACEVVFDSKDPTVVLVRRKELSPRMAAVKRLLEAQGITIKEEKLTLSPASKELEASMSRLNERLKDLPIEPSDPPDEESASGQSRIPNPFYSRDKQ